MTILVAQLRAFLPILQQSSSSSYSRLQDKAIASGGLSGNMFIKYFIPEDGDDQAHPNIFRIDTSQPSFAVIKNAFPVPGSYHFRFLKNIGSHIVWLDITDESAALPTHQGNIFIKVTRVSNPTQTSSTPAAPVHQFVPSFEPTPASFAATPAESTPQVSPPVKAPKPAVDRRNSEKLLKFDDEVTSPVSAAAPDLFAPTSAPIATSASLLSDDLLGIGSNSDAGTSKSAAPATSADFFGLDTLKPVSNVMGGSGNGSRSISPMGGMNGMGGMPAGPGGPMGGMGAKPMGAGSVGSGMNNMGMHGASPMGGGPGMNPMGGRGGMGMGMGPPPQQQAPPRPMGGPGSAGYDPFNSIGGLSGMPPNRGAGAGTGMNGRR